MLQKVTFKRNHGSLKKAVYELNEKVVKNLKGLKEFHLCLHTIPLSRITKDNLNILYMSWEAKTVFSPEPWFHLDVHVKVVATSWGLNCIH